MDEHTVDSEAMREEMEEQELIERGERMGGIEQTKEARLKEWGE